MNILVTGGAGYIGSHTCVQLLERGHGVVVVDNFCNAKPEALANVRRIAGHPFEFIEADLRDEAALEEIFARYRFDVVIHFAGLKAVGESVEKPLEYYDNNIGGTLSLLNTMRRHNVKKIVFSSSATVYGVDNPMPLKEGYPTSAINPYGYTKVVIERMLQDIAAADTGWSVCLLRYFNPVGAHVSGLIGEEPSGIPNNLMPYVALVAAGRMERVRVFGNDYDTEDGTGVRDYIHVVDLASGHLAALAYVADHTGATAINLGTGKGTSVLEMIRAFEKACGKTIPFQIEGRRAGDVAVCYADVSRAKTLLGWESTLTIERMCEDGWRYIRNRIKSDSV